MTKYNPDVHHRKTIRLKDYDYADAGGYFITICTHNWEWQTMIHCINLFGEIEGGKMVWNDAGEMIVHWWNEIKNKFPNIELDEYCCYAESYSWNCCHKSYCRGAIYCAR